MGQQKRKSEVLDYQFLRRKTKTMRISTPAPAAINSIPQDLLIEILAKVAASSCTDLLNAKLANKVFLEASNDAQIFQQVSLQSFEKVSWKKKKKDSPKFLWFIQNCNNNGNPEALYRKGMLEFFSLGKQASGLANLKSSAQKGHVDASYVYGVVLYLTSSPLQPEGAVQFLKNQIMCEPKLGVDVAECRRRIKSFVGEIWIQNNEIFNLEDNWVLHSKKFNCNCTVNNKKEIKRWGWSDEDNNYGEHTCEMCKWNGEVFRFCNMLKTGRYN